MSGYTVNYDSQLPDVAFNDLFLDANGNLAYVETGDAEVEETCFHAVQLTVGDYSYNTTLGTPYDDYLRSDAPIGYQIRRSIGNAVLAVNGVNNIDTFNLALDATTRKLQIAMVIKLATGAQFDLNL